MSAVLWCDVDIDDCFYLLQCTWHFIILSLLLTQSYNYTITITEAGIVAVVIVAVAAVAAAAAATAAVAAVAAVAAAAVAVAVAAVAAVAVAAVAAATRRKGLN